MVEPYAGCHLEGFSQADFVAEENRDRFLRSLRFDPRRVISIVILGAVAVGDIVTVWVTELDLKKGRVGLSMIGPENK